jgi:putative ABC transport system permease protein
MTLLRLALKSTFNRKGAVLLTLFAIAISVMVLLTIERVRIEAKTSFSNTLSGTDLIVGAKTGDIQLLLASVFRIGYTTTGVSWQSYQDIKSKKGVAWTIPLSLGDSHKGFAVLGTDRNYFTHFRYGNKQALSLAKGAEFSQPNEVVLGADVANTLGYQLGTQIVLAHGLGKTSFHHHDDHPLTVVGILSPTGTPVDKTVHVPLAAIDTMHGTAKKSKATSNHEHHGDHNGHDDNHKHEHEDEHEHEHKHAHTYNDLVGHPSQISAFLMGFDSPLYTLQVRRNINLYKAEPLLAIMPTVTLRELWEMLGMVEKLLLLFSIALVVVSLLGMLTSMLATLQQRRRELAILRSVGARPHHIISLLIGEAAIITTLGVAIGTALFYVALSFSSELLQAKFGLSLTLTWLSRYELLLLGAIIAAGSIIGLIPALRAYFYSLADGMSIKV